MAHDITLEAPHCTHQWAAWCLLTGNQTLRLGAVPQDAATGEEAVAEARRFLSEDERAQNLTPPFTVKWMVPY